MPSSKENFDDFDFHLFGARDDGSSKIVFEAYLELREAAARLPKAYREQGINLLIHKLLKESLHSKERRTLYRKKADADEALSLYWLSRVSEAACFFEAWRNPPPYTQISQDFLNEFARLSENPENIKLLEEILASNGIILVHEKVIPGMKVDGVSFLLSSGRPVIGMSLRYARLDIYWFVLMHELAHIIKHYDKLNNPILDDFDEDNQSDIEIEANLISANALIPRSIWRSANVKYSSSESEILACAKSARTHPAIVAGRLQRETGKHQVHASLVNSVNVRKIIFGHE